MVFCRMLAILDNAELSTRARARGEFYIAHNGEVAMLSVMDNSGLSARARGEFCIVHNREVGRDSRARPPAAAPAQALRCSDPATFQNRVSGASHRS